MSDDVRVNWLSIAEIREIGEEFLPMLVLSDRMWSWVAMRIRSHTHGSYNHAMIYHRRGYLASQGWRMAEEPLVDFLTPEYRLKFWWSPYWTVQEKEDMRALTQEKLTARGKYDWLGIIGQRIGRPGLNFKGRDFCSEVAAEVLRIAEPSLTMEHPSPSDLNAWAKQNPRMMVWGIRDPDLDR